MKNKRGKSKIIAVVLAPSLFIGSGGAGWASETTPHPLLCVWMGGEGRRLPPPHFCTVINNFLLSYHGQLIKTLNAIYTKL